MSGNTPDKSSRCELPPPRSRRVLRPGAGTSSRRPARAAARWGLALAGGAVAAGCAGASPAPRELPPSPTSARAGHERDVSRRSATDLSRNKRPDRATSPPLPGRCRDAGRSAAGHRCRRRGAPRRRGHRPRSEPPNMRESNLDEDARSSGLGAGIGPTGRAYAGAIREGRGAASGSAHRGAESIGSRARIWRASPIVAAPAARHVDAGICRAPIGPNERRLERLASTEQHGSCRSVMRRLRPAGARRSGSSNSRSVAMPHLPICQSRSEPAIGRRRQVRRCDEDRGVEYVIWLQGGDRANPSIPASPGRRSRPAASPGHRQPSRPPGLDDRDARARVPGRRPRSRRGLVNDST